MERRTYFFLFLIFFFAFSYEYFIKAKHLSEFTNEDLVTVDNLILKEQPDIQKTRNSGRIIKLKFINYNNTFLCVTDAIAFFPEFTILNFKSGDTVKLKILKSELQELNKNFIAKNIEFYSLTVNNTTLFYELSWTQGNFPPSFLLGGLCLLFFLCFVNLGFANLIFKR